jgi:hypothetical protein
MRLQCKDMVGLHKDSEPTKRLDHGCQKASEVLSRKPMER